jgi:2'-5' RNA ligase
MLVDRTPDSAELRDHWWWRPGWEPGSRHLQWCLTFEGARDLHRLAERVQRSVAGIDALEPVPEDCVRRVINAAHHRLADAPRVDLTFSRVSVYAESVVLAPDPSSSLEAVQAVLEESGRHALGQDAPGITVPFAPHLSVAYAIGPAAGDSVVDALQALREVEPVQAAPTLSLVEVERDGRSYTWRLVSAFPL